MKKTVIILLIICQFLALSLYVSAADPIASFNYTISGAKITCTSTSQNTNNSTQYQWQISTDGVHYSSTEWLIGDNGTTYLFTHPDGGHIRIQLTVKYNNYTHSVEKVTNNLDPSKDHYEPDEYHNCKACEDAGYFWYDDSCHDDPKPRPWNVKDDYPEAGPEDGFTVEFGGWNVDLTFFVVIGIIILAGIVFNKNKKNRR